MSMETRRIRKVLSGNHAASYAVKLANVDVIPIYPITPQTTIVEKIVDFVENNEMKAEVIHADSEHSAMAAAIGASASGARVYTATSSHGLLYMYEMIWWAANARLPIVAGFVTRSIGPPWNIWSDHNDYLTLRDSGWIMFFASSAQEVFDMTLQAFKVAENPRIRLPVGVAWDGFQISHSFEPVELLRQEEVDAFLPDPRDIKPLLNVDEPISIGNLPIATDNMMFRESIWRSMERARDYIKDVMNEYRALSRRNYGYLIEEYKAMDAETIFITMGAISGDAKIAVDKLRENGERVGLARIRVIRPMPVTDLVRLGRIANNIVVIDRNVSMGLGGILAREIKSIFYDFYVETPTYGFITGLAGTEVSPEDYIKIYRMVLDGEVEPSTNIWYYHGGVMK